MPIKLRSHIINNDPSPFSPQVLEKAEIYLNQLLTFKESDPEAQEIIPGLARELDENQALAEIFLQKITSPKGSFSPWFLPGLSRRVQSKSVRKGIKRALYLLKQKGIEPPPSTNQQEKPEIGILKNIEPFQTAGYLSEFDGLKNQMVGLLIPKPTQGRLFIFALIGSDGLESMTVMEVRKKEVKDILADLEGQAGHQFFPADFPHAVFLLKEAHDRHSKLPKEEEEIYAGIIHFLEGKKRVGQSPIIRTLLDREKLRPSSSDIQWLLQVPEIFYLLPDPSIMESYFLAVQAVRNGILVLNEMQQRERLMSIVEKAVRELFPPERLAGLGRYLEEVAYLYFLRKKTEEAEALYYWANTLGEAKESRQGQGNPFLLWLMETVLSAQENSKTPTAATKEQTTEGGIILPAWVRREENR